MFRSYDPDLCRRVVFQKHIILYIDWSGLTYTEDGYELSSPNADAVKMCLKNTFLYMFGDSHMRQMFNYILNIVGVHQSVWGHANHWRHKSFVHHHIGNFRSIIGDLELLKKNMTKHEHYVFVFSMGAGYGHWTAHE